MAAFPFKYHQSDDLQEVAFTHLKLGWFDKADDLFSELISRKKFINRLNNKHDKAVVANLGKLWRKWVEALWQVKRYGEALIQIKLCQSEGCLECSEETATFWVNRGDLAKEKHVAIHAYEIAVYFTPPNLTINRCQLLSNLLVLCSESGPVMKKKALELIDKAFQLDPSPSQELAKMWLECGKKLMSSVAFISVSTQCFSLALKYLPSTDSGMKAKICFCRANSNLKLTGNLPGHELVVAATRDARFYTEQCPKSAKGYSLMWKCYLCNHDCDNALEAFGKVMGLIDREEDKEKEFVKFFTTAVTQKAFEVFKKGCPAPSHFVQKLVIECAEKKAILEISLLFCGGWAADCDASCVPLDAVLQEDLKERDELVTCLLKHKARVTGVQGSAKSPLAVCIQSGNWALAVILLQHGANPADVVDKDGESPLNASLRIGLRPTGDFAVMKYFLSTNEDSANVQDKEGNTLLHVVCRGKNSKKKQEAIELLLAAGANPGICNTNGERPVDIVSNLRDNRRNVLSSAEKSLKVSPSSSDDSTMKQSEENKAEAKEEKRLPKRSENTPETSSSSKTKAPPSPSKKSKKKSGKESLAAVRERILSFIRKIDVREWLRSVASLEQSSRKKHVEKEKPDSMVNQPSTSQGKGGEEVRSTGHNTDVNQRTAVHQENTVDIDDGCGTGPTKASEPYLDGAFEGLPWEVECTEEVWKILHGKRLESWKKKQFVEKVRNLAQGRDNWTLHLCKRLEGLPKSHGMLLYETRLTDAARIIWECAVAFSPRYSNEDVGRKTKIYSEIIRVWDIVFDHDNVPRRIENIVKSYTRGQDCILKKELKGMPRGETASEHQGPNLFSKVSQPTSPAQEELEGKEWKDERKDVEHVTFFPPASPDDNEYQVLKFYHFSTAMIRTILQQECGHDEVDFPFRVTEEEHDIINYHPFPQSSIILIGRSGTGKTTCILYRLWKDFMKYWSKAVESGPLLPKKSVFVPKENSDIDPADRAEDSEERSRSDVPNEEEASGIVATSHESIEAASSCCSDPSASGDTEVGESLEHLHQLFVTKNGVLCEEIQKNFNALSQACSFKAPSSKQEFPPVTLQDVEDSTTGWPLFLNAHNLYLMLDASLPEPYFFPRAEDGSLRCRIKDWGEETNQLSAIPLIGDSDDEDDEEDSDDDEEDEMQDMDGDGSTSDAGRSMTLVSYSIFENRLWAKMCRKKKKVNFHPSLVWMEIRSFIKGSYEALHTERGFLSLESYQTIGQKRAPNFTGDREAIYKLFESYERVKRSCNMFDENDLVFHLYHRLRHCRVPEWSIHNLYVDETQDFTQAELMLLIRCCRDPNGVFLTGDTAQGVMRGISFRFEDLRSLFFYVNKSYKAVGTQAEVVVPEIKPLIHNYRSHSGILNLASSVVGILQEYLPESFDKLEKDQGQLDGPKPVLLGSCSHSDLAIILRGNQRKTSTIEFGAHQAILVSSNEARERLPEELSQALVLTIYEAKGLEFDDVLIYNFFKDSQGQEEWRVVTQFLLNQHGEEVNANEVVSRPLTFNSDKHKILSSELKQLYTAVTRARAKVWFFDEDEDKRRPVFEYFQHLGLAEVVKLEADLEGNEGESQSLENMFSKGSTLYEWEKQGTFFYSKKLWRVAQKCFEVSGNVEMSQKCKAYVQADHARSLHNEPRQLKTEFLLAADQFLQCNMIQEARACLFNARERSLYASLLQKLGKEKIAAKWFEKIGNFSEAGKCLQATNDYREAVEVYIRGNLYNQAIETLKRYNQLPQVNKSGAPGRTTEELYLASAELHSKAGKTTEMNASLQHIKSVDARVDFLKKHKLFKEAANQLLNAGRGIEAARIEREHGSPLDASKLAKESGDLNLAADCIFAHVRSSKEIPQETQIAQLEEAKELYKEAGNWNSFGEVLLKEAKLAMDHEKVIEAEKLFKRSPVYNTCGALECVEFLCDAAGDSYHIPGMQTWIAIKIVGKVLELIHTLTTINQNMLMQKEIDLCEEHFGLLKEGDSSKRVVRRTEGDRFLGIAQGLEKRPVAGNKWELDLGEARERIAESLFYRVDRVIRKIRGFLTKAITTHETCRRFLAGFPCDVEECYYRHSAPSEESTDTLFLAMLDDMFFDAQADDFRKLKNKYSTQKTVGTRSFKRRLSSSNTVAHLEDPFPDDTFVSCMRLLDFFFPSMGQSVSKSKQKYIGLLRDGRRSFHKGRLDKFAVELWKNRATSEQRVADVNLFLKVSCVLQLIGSPPSRVQSWIKKEEDDFRVHFQKSRMDRIPGTVGIAYERRDPPLFTFFVKWWEESKQKLHVHYRILDSGHLAVRRFLTMTVNPRKKLPYPSPCNCLAILEHQMCVFTALYARCCHYRQTRCQACLPGSYLSQIDFWDTLNCTTKNHVGIFLAATRNSSHPGTVRKIQNFLGYMVSLMLGGYARNFNVIVKVLSDRSFTDSGETERALVLVLTMLCNCGHAFPKECEFKLVENLFAKVPDDVEFPERIERCLKEVRQAQGIRDIVQILERLLKARQEELFDVRWCNYQKRLLKGNVNAEVYLETFNSDVLEKLASKTTDETEEKVLSAKDVSESEDAKDELAEDFDDQAEEEPSTDLDHSETEKLEAIEKEMALKEETWREDLRPEETVSTEVFNAVSLGEDPIAPFFSSIQVDRSGCGICDVLFDTEDQEISEFAMEGDERIPERTNLDASSPACGLRRRGEAYNRHFADGSPHWEKEKQFEAFKTLFREQLLPSVTEEENLVKEAEEFLQIADQQGKPWVILSSKLSEVKRANSQFLEEITKIQQECSWVDVESFKASVKAFQEALQACREEMKKESSRRRGKKAGGNHSSQEVLNSWDAGNDPEKDDGYDGYDRYVEVPGLRKKKK